MGKSVCSIYSIQTRLFEKGFRGNIKKRSSIDPLLDYEFGFEVTFRPTLSRAGIP